MKKNTKNLFKIIIITLFQMLINNESKACDYSSLSINKVSNLGSNKYKIELQFCAGHGYGGASQSTQRFAFYVSKNATIDTFDQLSLQSPATGSTFYALKFKDPSKNIIPYTADVLIYHDSMKRLYWTCIKNTCGMPQSICSNVTIYTIGLPDTLWIYGMEGGGNIKGGCKDLMVFPKCYNSNLTANAGSDQTIYKGYSGNCVTLNGCANNGAGTYTYLWNTGASNSSISVCPTVGTNYTLTVTDANGCKSKDEVFVDYIDIRCSNNTKINVCYQNNTYCIKKNNASWYLQRGGSLGECGSVPFMTAINQHESEVEIKVYPTLTDANLNIDIKGIIGNIIYQIIDLNGKMVKEQSVNIINNELNTIEIPIIDLQAGVYLIQIKSKEKEYIFTTQRFIRL